MSRKNQELNQRIFPYEVLFLTVFILYLFAPVRGGDDVWFITNFLTGCQGDLIAFLSFRYETWSTRLLLEAYTLLLLYFPFLYRISMPLWITAIAGGFIRLLDIQDNRTRWGICLSMLLLPVSFNANAGFVCSTVNYVFTFACFLWAIIPIVECQRGKQIPIGQYIWSLILMIFACNMEYYCPPFLIYCIYLLIRGLKRRKGRVVSALMVMLCIGGLIFAFTAPASTVSSYDSVDQFFPGYELLSAMDKLQAGFVSTAGGLVSTSMYGNHFLLGTLVFTIIFGTYFMNKNHKIYQKIIVWIPLFITICTGFTARFLPENTMWRKLFFHSDAGWQWDSSIALVVAFLFFGCVLYGFFQVDNRLGWIFLLVLFCRVTMGASRSVFASGLRTFYPVLFVICIACGILLCKRERPKGSLAVFLVGILFTYIVNLFYLFTGEEMFL